MMDLVQAIPFSFGALFPVINPIGSSVIFLSMVNGSSRAAINTLATKISIYISIMLIIVLLVGTGILRLFGISIPIVLIGGGLVLAYIGWQLLNAPDVTIEDKKAVANRDTDIDQMAFYPLSMPITAGPGCIAVAIALGAHGIDDTWQTMMMNQIGNAIGIILVAITVFFCYRSAYALSVKLGPTGTRVLCV